MKSNHRSKTVQVSCLALMCMECREKQQQYNIGKLLVSLEWVIFGISAKKGNAVLQNAYNEIEASSYNVQNPNH